MRLLRPAFMLLAALATPAGAVTTGSSKLVLPFIHDDYARALTEARARKVPIFVESWAPW